MSLYLLLSYQKQWHNIKETDNQIGPVLKWVESGTPPSKSDLYQIQSKLTL